METSWDASERKACGFVEKRGVRLDRVLGQSAKLGVSLSALFQTQPPCRQL
jgi:hypothetical protein